MSKTMTAIQEVIYEAGVAAESARQGMIEDAAHSVVELLVQRALDDLAAEWRRDLSNFVIDTINVEAEVQSLVSEIESCIETVSPDETLEERYIGDVIELVRQQIEEQENDE